VSERIDGTEAADIKAWAEAHLPDGHSEWASLTVYSVNEPNSLKSSLGLRVNSECKQTA
jgi:hypothetical protein